MDTSSLGVFQPVDDGKLVDTSVGGNSISGATKKSNSSLDKEAFLQLLVAQMKYQDPLEPTSNTEYISQLATFSSLEEMQNLNRTMTDNQAASLVGKNVVMKYVSETTGNTSFISGKVDYIMRENGKTYLSIKDGLYNIEDLDTVVDDTYLDAITLADTFKAMMEKLPSKNQITLADKTKIELARKAYDSMTDYQKGYVSKELKEQLETLEAKIKELQAIEDAGKPEVPEEPEEPEVPGEDDKDEDDTTTEGAK